MADWLKDRKGFLQFIFFDYPWGTFGKKLLSYIFKLFNAFPNVKEEDIILDSCIPDEVTVKTKFFGFFSGRKNSYSNLRGKLLRRIL